MTKAFIHISELLPMDYKTPYLRGKEQNKLQILQNAYLLIEDGVVLDYGLMQDFILKKDYETVDCTNHLITPGLVDSHTHLVYGGSREQELALKMEGKSYLDLLQMGYGIHSTVSATKKATKEELLLLASTRLNKMIGQGVTTVECKSGYGLDEETELKQLQVVQDLNTPATLVSTFLGAHVIPKGSSAEDHLSNMKEFIQKYKNLFQFVDIFIEQGVFNVGDAEDYLNYAKSLGLGIRTHVDEIVPLSGTELSVKLQAASADHLGAASDQGIKDLANSQTVATLLPITTFYLDKPFAKARAMIDQGAIVAIGSDANPGSAPSENLQFAMNLALLKYHMTPAEIWHAVTINAAHSLRVSRGTLKKGAQADFVIWNCENHQYPLYHLAMNDCKAVYIQGKKVEETL